MKPTAHIESWFETGGYLVGEVSKHPRQSTFRVPIQCTSPIIARHPDGTVETENTIYTLGRKFGDVEGWSG